MGVFDELEKAKERELAEFNEAQRRAFEVYDKQLQAISGILNTDGYKEIKNFWERERDSSLQQLGFTSINNVVSLQEKYKLANSFLTFLNNFEKKLKSS